MRKSKILYDSLPDTEKKKLIHSLYVEDGHSFANIAESYDTYANKIRRDAKKFNIPIRDKSDAQKNALKTGKHKHPTKGQKRPDSVKEKIGLGVLNSWENMDEAELMKRKLSAKNNWENLDNNTKLNILQSANNAVRQASKTGSKLEKFIHKQLLSDGYKVEFHKEQILVNTKLQIDIFLPTISLAIEIDGPSHFEAVWGQDALQKNKKYDSKKEGLIIGKGWSLIRIIQTKDYSNTRSLLVYDKLKQILNQYVIDKAILGPQTFIIRDSDA